MAERGAQVMPFNSKAAIHIFTKAGDGGTQQVVARDTADAPQIQLIRQHLRDLRSQFANGDFSGPSHIHGDAMPGLAELKAATHGQLQIRYQEVDGGAQLRYRSDDAALVCALHTWFDAQLADHGTDAMAGHVPLHTHAPAP